MHNRILILLFSGLILTACKNNTATEPLTFSSESVTESDLPSCKNEDCPKITLNYELAAGDSSTSEAINKTLEKHIIASLQLGDDVITAKTIPAAMEYFVSRYRKDKEKFPDTTFEYEAKVDLSKLAQLEKLVSFELQSYQFAGGAHGYQATTFLNFNTETGTLLSRSELFKNEKEFKTFAETKFKEANNIAVNENINSTGFWFEDDTFFLPDTIGFTEDNLILYYNQYDIASYADGPIELEIPRKEAEAFLVY
ncbi:DUF3298 and DUF4163 domain-containing protein [Cochleicola gelatinilyticus]|uniref:Deacetylase PdaC domain-containing protein n=1 Tax=Cochleicola gelatinilyticus TaxID=1763537 RepID=A0A167J6Q3_9FLAO|nr:DUF3298 and DUF4163 domain-containing protein [Cochleicola gelatinilyticus]OAB80376.1 hypothetical protein ULVI_06480 [Cochleicola gelatinilyticus]